MIVNVIHQGKDVGLEMIRAGKAETAFADAKLVMGCGADPNNPAL